MERYYIVMNIILLVGKRGDKRIYLFWFYFFEEKYFLYMFLRYILKYDFLFFLYFLNCLNILRWLYIVFLLCGMGKDERIRIF